MVKGILKFKFNFLSHNINGEKNDLPGVQTISEVSKCSSRIYR